MNKSIITFAVGALMGAAGGYFYAQYKLQERYKEDVEEIKKGYAEEQAKAEEPVKEEKKPAAKPKSKTKKTEAPKEEEYEELVGTLKYTEPSKKKSTTTKKKKAKLSDPYIIGVSECGKTGNEVHSLTWYYEGDIVADEFDNILDDPDALIGVEWKAIAEDEDYRADHDVVCVRNDTLGRDYDICIDERTYEEVCGPIEE